MKTHEIADSERQAATLRALADPVCRELLEHLDEPKTADALVEECSVSSSTVYRKLDPLTESGLLAARVDVDHDFGHTTRYELATREVTVSLADVCRVSRRVDEE